MYFSAPMATLDIILPVYNPLAGWEGIIIQRFLSLENQLPEHQVQLIIVNDGSSKMDEADSVEKLKKNIPNLQWISYEANKGKGYALRSGVTASDADYIIYTDIDWPYTEQSMLGLFKELTSKADAVIGIREESYYTHLPPARRRIFRFLKKFDL